MATGYVVYNGPSAFDGKPIVVIMTGLDGSSDNPKTGPMIQTWIIRADVEPHIAVKHATDDTVCGDCKYRGGNGCYVKIHNAPLQVYRSWKRGNYPAIPLIEAGRLIRESGLSLRMGSYGDPAAVPFSIWHWLSRNAVHHSGYTHAWRRFDHLRTILMASVDSEDEMIDAVSLGWRTFRVRQYNEWGEIEPLMEGEIACPASNEMGNRTTCADCGLCGAWDRYAKDIAIINHGPQTRKYRLGNFPRISLNNLQMIGG